MRNDFCSALGVLLVVFAAASANAATPYNYCRASVYCGDGAADDCCRANSCCGDPWACEKNNCYCCDPWACEPNCDYGCVNSCNCDACEERCDLSWRLCEICSQNDCRCPRPHHYFSVFGGWSDVQSYSGESPVIPNPRQIGSFNDGWAIGVAAGRRFKQAYRGELEFAFRRNSAAVWNVDGVVEDWDGDLDTYFGMANLYHDCINWTWRGMTPYVGAGLGFAVFDGDLDTALARFKIDQAAFAYQGITGVTNRLHRAVDGFVEYRFVGTTDVALTRTTPNPEQEFGDFHGEFHNVLFGIRIWH